MKKKKNRISNIYGVSSAQKEMLYREFRRDIINELEALILDYSLYVTWAFNHGLEMDFKTLKGRSLYRAGLITIDSEEFKKKREQKRRQNEIQACEQILKEMEEKKKAGKRMWDL